MWIILGGVVAVIVLVIVRMPSLSYASPSPYALRSFYSFTTCLRFARLGSLITDRWSMIHDQQVAALNPALVFICGSSGHNSNIGIDLRYGTDTANGQNQLMSYECLLITHKLVKFWTVVDVCLLLFRWLYSIAHTHALWNVVLLRFNAPANSLTVFISVIIVSISWKPTTIRRHDFPWNLHIWGDQSLVSMVKTKPCFCILPFVIHCK